MRWMWAQLGIVSSFSLSPLSMNIEDIIPVWRGSEGMRSGSACLEPQCSLLANLYFSTPQTVSIHSWNILSRYSLVLKKNVFFNTLMVISKQEKRTTTKKKGRGRFFLSTAEIFQDD